MSSAPPAANPAPPPASYMNSAQPGPAGPAGPASNPYLPYPIQPYGGMPMPMPYGYPSGAPPTYDYANPAAHQQQHAQQPGAPGYPGYNAYPSYPYYNPAYPYAPPRPY